MDKINVKVFRVIISTVLGCMVLASLLTGCTLSTGKKEMSLFKPIFFLKDGQSAWYSGTQSEIGQKEEKEIHLLFEQQGCGSIITTSSFWKSRFANDFIWEVSSDSLYLEPYYQAAGQSKRETAEPYKVTVSGDSLFLTGLYKQYRLKRQHLHLFPEDWAPSRKFFGPDISDYTFVSTIQQDFNKESNFSEDVIETVKKMSGVHQMTRIVFSFNPDGSGLKRQTMAGGIGNGLMLMRADPILWQMKGDSLIYMVRKSPEGQPLNYERLSARITDTGEGIILSQDNGAGTTVSLFRKIRQMPVNK